MKKSLLLGLIFGLLLSFAGHLSIATPVQHRFNEDVVDGYTCVPSGDGTKWYLNQIVVSATFKWTSYNLVSDPITTGSNPERIENANGKPRLYYVASYHNEDLCNKAKESYSTDSNSEE
jgi:hypothetical protein